MTDATGTTTYAYDPMGRRTEEVSPRGRLAYTYDPAGRRASMTYPDDTEVAYTYDPAGRLTSLATPTGQITYAYDPDGRLTAEHLPQGMERTYAYEAGRLARYARGDDDDTEVTTLTYDQAGRRSAQRTNGRHVTYAYDPAGQLTHVGGGDHGEGNDTTFTYDPMGRRTSMTRGNHTTTYTYDQAGALTSTSARDHTTTYAYDQAGRRIERASGPETTTYAYDSAGRLASSTSTRGQDARTQARTYDGQGTLVGVAVSGGDDQAATTLVWDGATPIPEIAVVREANNEVNLVYGAGRALALHDEDVTVFDYDASHSALRDDDSLVRAQRYDVFGLPGDSSDTAITFGYRGEAHIGDLVHLRARDYDPETGTFTTRDPLDGVPGTSSATNPYPYADNDPINKVDPLGLRPSDAAFFGLLRPLVLPVRQIWWAGGDPLGSASGEYYKYSYILSDKASRSTWPYASEVMGWLKQDPKRYFPFKLGGSHPRITMGTTICTIPYGSECQNVQVASVDHYQFSFRALAGHSQGEGSWISFMIVPARSDDGVTRLWLTVNAYGDGSGWWQRIKNRAAADLWSGMAVALQHDIMGYGQPRP